MTDPNTARRSDITTVTLAPPPAQDLRAILGELNERLREHPDPALRGAFQDAQAAIDRQDCRRALSAYVAILERLEQDPLVIGDAGARRAFRQCKGACYARLARGLLEDGDPGQAFALLERRRARTFAETLAGRGPDARGPLERELLAEALRLDSGIQRMERAHPDEAVSSENERAFKERIADRARLASRMRSSAPRLFALYEPDPIPLERLRAIAAGDQTDVVQYVVTDQGVVVWHVGPTSTTAISVAVSREQLRAEIGALVGRARDCLPLDGTLAHQLFLYLLQPVYAQLDPSRRLTIIAAEELGALPFQLLQDPHSPKTLGETFRIAYLPSAAAMAALRPDRCGIATVLSVVNSTLAPRDDIEAAREDSTHVTVLGDPSTQALFAVAGGYDAIHFLAEASFAAHVPLLASLRLAPATGVVTAAEMFTLTLTGTRLVTIGACEAGGAQAISTDEMSGMVRALFFAGTQSVLAPLWNINAESASLYFRTFYRAARNQPVDEAARQALVAVRHRFPHPYHWAPFMYFGR